MELATTISDTVSSDTVSTNDTVDPVAVAIEAYIEGTAGASAESGFPWVAAIGFLLVIVAVFVGVVVLRRRFA